jgi:hypothetical protein
MSHTPNTNEQGHIWINRVNDYVCPSYLNKIKTDFYDKESEYMYNLHWEHYGRRKHQAASLKRQATEKNPKVQAPSSKPQAPSRKRQAP